MSYVVPIFLILIFVYGLIKKVPLFDTFIEGIKEALKLVLNIMPYLLVIFIAIELFRKSGLSGKFAEILSPAFNFFGIPAEVAELIVLRPLSGSGSLVILEGLYQSYGVDSYIARTASVIMASTDTIMYVSAVYFSTSKDKKSGLAIPIALVSSIIGAVITSFLVKLI